MNDRWFDLRWWFRRECRAIARDEKFDGGIRIILLCSRRRWHRGGCA